MARPPAWLPNAISALRGLAALPLFLLILDEAWVVAFWLALIAGSSDLLDGAIARHWKLQSRLGGWLDPLADKALVAAAMLGLTVVGLLPVWLVVLVLARDLWLLAGSTAYQFKVAPLYAEPSLLGKLCTFSQILLAAAALWTAGRGWPGEAFIIGWIWLVTALTLVSGLHYTWVWLRRARSAGNSGDGT